MIFTTSELLKEKKTKYQKLESVRVDSAWIFDYKIVISSRWSFVFLKNKNNNSNPPLQKKIIQKKKKYMLEYFALCLCAYLINKAAILDTCENDIKSYPPLITLSPAPQNAPYQNYFSLKKWRKLCKIVPKNNAEIQCIQTGYF